MSNKIAIAVACFVVGVLVSSTRATPSESPQWEYSCPTQIDDKKLKALGEEGWELTTATAVVISPTSYDVQFMTSSEPQVARLLSARITPSVFTGSNLMGSMCFKRKK